MIADTDLLISLLKDDDAAIRKVRELEAEAVPIKIPAMAVLELYIGVGAELTDDEESRVRSILSGYPILPMTSEVAMRAGRRIGEGNVSSLKRKKGDAAIAATAQLEGEPVVTRNVDDFEALGATVERY